VRSMRQPMDPLAFAAERLAARRQNLNARRAGEQSFDQRGHGVDDMLASVDDDQHLLASQKRDEIGDLFVLPIGQAERRGQFTAHQRRVSERTEVDETGFADSAEPFGDSQSDGRLADAAGADERDEASLRQLLGDRLDDFSPAKDQRDIRAGVVDPGGRVFEGRTPRGCGRRCVGDGHRRHEPIAAPRFADDVADACRAVAEQFSDAADVDAQIRFVHRRRRPRDSEQLLFAQKFARMFGEHDQKVERAAADRRQRFPPQQKSLFGKEPIGTESKYLR
jgi:hypothetical protein